MNRHADRHADELDDFFQVVQATLNRNGHKPGLESMDDIQVIAKTAEEFAELIRELEYGNPFKAEREAADLAVCALAAFMWARRAA